jgi:hypothetical protein
MIPFQYKVPCYWLVRWQYLMEFWSWGSELDLEERTWSWYVKIVAYGRSNTRRIKVACHGEFSITWGWGDEELSGDLQSFWTLDNWGLELYILVDNLAALARQAGASHSFIVGCCWSCSLATCTYWFCFFFSIFFFAWGECWEVWNMVRKAPDSWCVWQYCL